MDCCFVLVRSHHHGKAVGQGRACKPHLPVLYCLGECIGILGDPGAASRDDGIFMGESLQQERESPWALALTDPVPEAFEFSPSDWPEKHFSGQSEGGISNASGTRSVRVSAQGLSRSCCKLSPMKIPSSLLAAPGSPRMVHRHF